MLPVEGLEAASKTHGRLLLVWWRMARRPRTCAISVGTASLCGGRSGKSAARQSCAPSLRQNPRSSALGYCFVVLLTSGLPRTAAYSERLENPQQAPDESMCRNRSPATEEVARLGVSSQLPARAPPIGRWAPCPCLGFSRSVVLPWTFPRNAKF